jgi:hypothetical protein
MRITSMVAGPAVFDAFVPFVIAMAISLGSATPVTFRLSASAAFNSSL